MVQQGIQMAGAWSKKDNEKLTSYITKWLYSKPNSVTMMAKKYITNLTFIVWHKMDDYNGTRTLNKASL